MGQIIKSVCFCLYVCLSVCLCVVILTVAFLCRFSPNLTQRCNLEFGPYLWPKRTEYDDDVRFLTGSRNKAVSRMRNEKYAIWLLVMAESTELLHSSAMDL